MSGNLICEEDVWAAVLVGVRIFRWQKHVVATNVIDALWKYSARQHVLRPYVSSPLGTVATMRPSWPGKSLVDLESRGTTTRLEARDLGGLY